MGYQVIKQPDGLLAIFSSYTDTWAVYDATGDEVVDWFAEQAAKSARRDAAGIVSAIQVGKPRQVYYQFAMTFDEANAKSGEHGGEVLAPTSRQP